MNISSTTNPFYLVMEFINGKGQLEAVEDCSANRGAIEDGLIVYLGIEIADALEIIHLQDFIPIAISSPKM